MNTHTLYLDHAAHSPLRPEAINSYSQSLANQTGNPASIHSIGRHNALLLAQARDRLARQISADSNEIIFTSGGTEANNLAIKGLALANTQRGRHIISTKVEHPAVFESLKWLEKEGWQISWLEPDQYGLIKLDQVKATVRDDTCLVSIIWANNELGTLNPTEEIGLWLEGQNICFHSDAVQFPTYQAVNVQTAKVTALSFSAAKFGGPAGSGFLWLKAGTNLENIQHGGHQELGFRPGTENLAAANATASAWEAMESNREAETRQQVVNRSALMDICADIPDLQINTHPEKHVNHILNVAVPGVEGESLFIRLDLAGVAVSNGSACSSGSQQPSKVLLAIGLSRELARATLRISWGWNTKLTEIEQFGERLKTTIEKLR